LNRRSAKSLPLVEKAGKAKYGWNFSASAADWASFISPRWPAARRNGGNRPAAKNFDTGQIRRRLVPLLQPLGLKILLEPGRFISGNAGILVTRVEYVKRTGKKNFVIVDAAMNDFIRPAFYDSYHEIVPLTKMGGAMISSDVVGGICESGDYFCKDRPLPKVGEGDYHRVVERGRLRLGHGFKLQFASAANGSFGERQKIRRRARAPGRGEKSGRTKKSRLSVL
jgi:hypothetical protein